MKFTFKFSDRGKGGWDGFYCRLYVNNDRKCVGSCAGSGYAMKSVAFQQYINKNIEKQTFCGADGQALKRYEKITGKRLVCKKITKNTTVYEEEI